MKKKVIPKGPQPVVRCAYSEMVPLSRLKENPLNPNVHSKEQIDFFVGVLKYQGVRRPITVSKRSGFITRGHGLLEAIRKCGYTSAPVDFQDYDSDEQELADIVADNELARLSMTDRKLIDDIALKLPESFDLKLLAIPHYELPKPLATLTEKPEKQGTEKKLIRCPECAHEFTMAPRG